MSDKPHRRAAEQLGTSIRHCKGCHDREIDEADYAYEQDYGGAYADPFPCGCCCCKAHNELETRGTRRKEEVDALRKP